MGSGASTSVSTDNNSDEFNRLKQKFLEEKAAGNKNEEIFKKLTELEQEEQKKRGDEEKNEEEKENVAMRRASSGEIETLSKKIKSDNDLKVNTNTKNVDLSNRTLPHTTKNVKNSKKKGTTPLNRSSLGTSGREIAGGGANRRGQIFNKGISDFTSLQARVDADLGHKSGFHFEDPATKEVLKEALQKFFFIGEEVVERMHLVLEALSKEVIPADNFIIRQGEVGDKLYVIQSGELDIFINGNFIRQLSRGDIVGELALLYNAPRSASVKTKTDCVLWSLRREVFREVQAIASSASLVARTALLMDVPLLSNLPQNKLSRIAGALQNEIYRENEIVLDVNSLTEKCYLVEDGELIVTLPGATKRKQVLSKLNAYLPKQRNAGSTPRHSFDPTNNIIHNNNLIGSSSVTSLDGFDEKKSNSKDNDDDNNDNNDPYVVIGKGSFLGIPVLCSESHRNNDFYWHWNQNNKKATCPLQIKFISRKCKLNYFTVSQFETMLGSVTEVLAEKVAETMKKSGTIVDMAVTIDFQLSDLEERMFLGRGSFGRVSLVKTASSRTLYALKAISKTAVIQGGQLNHVKDEKVMLETMLHPFILRLFKTFQDHDCIYFLTEAVLGGDLWSILYEGISGQGCEGLPPNHCTFYLSTVASALGYMHQKGVAYRDLKPENIMVDQEGYLKVIDLGFAKKIPFSIEVNGQTQIHPRSYTMCGTPEYLAPEFIFNTGHDHSVDLWALGVLAFEIIMGFTPFVPPGDEENMTALFTNIACVKRRGVNYPDNYDMKAGGPESRDLVIRLLQHSPNDRLGNQARGILDVKEHPYFQEIDWELLESRQISAPWNPPQGLPHVPVDDDGEGVDQFQGDQSVFAEF